MQASVVTTWLTQSSRVRTHNHQLTVAARQKAARKLVASRS
jgi:hypothetical protein